jgi:Na+/phosphate symporter
MDRIENDASNNSIVACVFAAAVTFLLSCSLATIGGYTQTDSRDL